MFVTNWLDYEKFLSNKIDLMKDLLFFAFLNWFKVVVGPFGQSNMHRRLDFCPDQPGRNQKLKNNLQLTVLIYTVSCMYHTLGGTLTIYYDKKPKHNKQPLYTIINSDKNNGNKKSW